MAENSVPRTAAQPEGNVKETIESILVAFILAFIFRAFVVEAFVIPTGSMAPTLYGAHMRLRCPDCGYTFDAGFSNNFYGGHHNDDDTDVPSAAPRLIDYHCPNCGHVFPSSGVDGTSQPIRFGDRILVLKYLYLFEKPRRWDVVVFKSPSEREHDPNDPDYGQNYIKRLIASGPESVVIMDGDIYTGPPGAERPEQFTIQRKPTYVQNSLWRNVYDNDYVPVNPSSAFHQPWQAAGGSGWDLGAPHPSATQHPSRLFSFENAQGSGAIAFSPEANPNVHALTDYLSYDEFEHTRGSSWRPTYVSDLNLSCFYTRKSGDGPLRLQLTKNADCFTAEISPGKVTLLRSKRVAGASFSTVNETAVKSVNLPDLGTSRPAKVQLINVDYRVTVRVDDRDVIVYEYPPDVAALWEREEHSFSASDEFARPQVRIVADRQACTLEHITLSRDIYYLSRSGGMPWWGTTGKIMHLNAGEYFVMGDNSFISGDARYWNDPIRLPHEGIDFVDGGRVPERFMLGKAFFVYWPAGYPMVGTNYNVVPDFGEMRFIH